MSIQLFDVITLDKTRTTKDGYLVTEAKVARTGIQLYRGYEMGKRDLDMVRVWRPETEVFKDEAMASFTSIPVTLDHPDENVNAGNWRKYAVGFTGEGVAKDGAYLRVPLALKDANAIKAVDDGKRELSCGYDCDIEWTKGKSTDGEDYDAIQRNIRGNHLAIVGSGRAGPDCRIGDIDLVSIRTELRDHKLDEEKKPMATKTVVFDGISIETTDQGAQAIEKLQGRVTDLEKKFSDAETAHSTAIKAKDTELGTKDGEIEKLKKSQLDEKAIDALAEKKAAVVAKARTIDKDGDYAGKSAPEIRKTAVAKKVGDDRVKDRSDDYIEALFDSLASDAEEDKGDPVRDHIKNGGDSKPSTAEEAYKKMSARLTDAWKGETKGAA